jgi:hypothetical protein
MVYCVKSNPWHGVLAFKSIDEALAHAKDLIERGYSVHIYPMPA